MILEKFQPSHKLHFKRFYKTQPPPWPLMMNGTEGGVMRGWRSFLECLLLICLKGNCQTWWDKSQLFLDGMKSRIARFLQCLFSCVAFFDRNLNSKKSAPILWSWDLSLPDGITNLTEALWYVFLHKKLLLHGMGKATKALVLELQGSKRKTHRFPSSDKYKKSIFVV